VNQCEVNISRIDLYLDDELAGGDLEAFNRHMRECSSCREELIERRRFLERIRAARPLYAASPKLRAEVAAVLGEPVGSRTVPARGRPVTRIMGKSRALAWVAV
jgi:anti-sigma factor RsiW